MKLAFFGDPHFRSTAPEARKDDYITNQENLIKWIDTTFKDYMKICNGDLLHKSREPVKRSMQDVDKQDTIGFIYYLLEILPEFYGVVGNHDLLYHSMDALNRTTMGILIKTGKYKLLSDQPLVVDNTYIYGYHFGQEIKHVPKRKTGTNIAVYHGMVMNEPNDFYDGLIAGDILKEFPEYDMIVTGDNHKQFITILDDRVLINPGSLKRDNADQVDHTPFIFTYDTETKTVDKVQVPTHWDILSDEHIELDKQRDDRLKELSEKFKMVRDITLDYRANLDEYYLANKVDDDLQIRVLRWME